MMGISNHVMARVTLWSTPSCRYCRLATMFFRKHGIVYEEYNVLEDTRAREEMAHLSHQLGTPVIRIGNEIFVGFDRKAIGKALDLGRRI